MEFFLNQFHRYRKEGLEALKAGDRERARFSFLKAAEFLYKLASGSDGKLRVLRKESARKLVEMAKRIGTERAGRTPSGAAEVVEGERAAGKGDFRVRERPKVGFDDIAGLEDVKEKIRLKIVYPFKYPERAAEFRIRRGGGILLYGPPGTGKTMLAKAVAGEVEADFFTVKPSEIMSKWVGEAEKNIEALFESARDCPRSVIFVDEIDALAPSRRRSESSVMARVVPQILAELEGFGSGGRNPMLFIGATNEPWSLDPAILRPGRFDEKIYVGLPDLPAIRRVLELSLEGRPLAPDVDLDRLADRLVGYTPADIKNICEKAAGDAFLAAVKTNEDHPIAMDRLEATVRETRPSVGPEELRRFEAYRKKV